MEENFKSKIGFSLFIFIVLFLAIGGFFFTQYMINNKDPKKNNIDDVISYKIDEDKDYIYFINENTISDDGNLFYKDVVINIKGEEELTESLEIENKAYKDSVQYISKQSLINEGTIPYKYDDIYALINRIYEVYTFDRYVSLVIKDYNYFCYDLLTFSKTKSYVYDTSSGLRISEENLLKKYNTSLDKIKEEIKTTLEKSQTLDDEGREVINIYATLNNFNNYSLYINDVGKLCITYLVKSIEKDYNLSMEV